MLSVLSTPQTISAIVGVSVIASIATGFTFVGKKDIKMLLSSVLMGTHTVMVLLALPLYFLSYTDNNEMLGLYVMGCCYIMMLIKCPTWIIKKKANTEINSYCHSQSPPSSKLNKKERTRKCSNMRIAWYATIGCINLVVLCECIAYCDLRTAIKNVAYLNAFLSVIMSRVLLISVYTPNTLKIVWKHTFCQTNDDVDVIASPSNAKNLKVGGMHVNNRGLCTSFIWVNIIALAILMCLSIYQLIGIPSTIDAILQFGGIHISLLFYITLTLINGTICLYKLVNEKFIWSTRKKRYTKFKYALHSIQTIAISYALICLPAMSDSLDNVIHLRVLIFPHYIVTAAIFALNIFTIVVILAQLVRSFSKRSSEKDTDFANGSINRI